MFIDSMNVFDCRLSSVSMLFSILFLSINFEWSSIYTCIFGGTFSWIGGRLANFMYHLNIQVDLFQRYIITCRISGYLSEAKNKYNSFLSDYCQIVRSSNSCILQASSIKFWIFSNPPILTFCFETVILGTHNICFVLEKSYLEACWVILN